MYCVCACCVNACVAHVYAEVHACAIHNIGSKALEGQASEPRTC